MPATRYRSGQRRCSVAVYSRCQHSARLRGLCPPNRCEARNLRTYKTTHTAGILRATALDEQQLLDIVPRDYAARLEDVDAQNMLNRLEAEGLHLSDFDVRATFVGPVDASSKGDKPLVLLHGFDGSCLEFRRLKPLLDPHIETWALDLLGNGFCVPDMKGSTDVPLGPVQRRQHLYTFWKQKCYQIKRPMTLAGTSLGAAAATDFALAHPEAVERLVLIGPQVLTDGIGPVGNLPDFAARLGVKVLQSDWLRNAAGKMAYNDKTLATEEAMRVNKLHTFVPGWQDAAVAFIRSGGYRVSKQFSTIRQPTTIIWGTKDRILDPAGGKTLADQLPNARLLWVENCGHAVHLERPHELARLILAEVGAA